MALHRRTFLATAGALCAGALAGCAHPNAVLTMDEVTATEVADRHAIHIDPDSSDHDLLARAVTNGSVTANDSSQLRSDRPYAYDGAYYDTTYETVDEFEATRVSVEVDYDPVDDPEAVPLSAFEGPDHDLLSGLFPPREDRSEGPDFGAGRVYSQAEADASRLVDGKVDAVRYEGEAYPVTVETRPATVRQFRYEVTRVAPDATTLGARLKDEYQFTLTGLSQAERDLVEEAIDEGYYDGGGSDAFESLARTLREHARVSGEEGGTEVYLVRYEGTDYWTELYAPFI